MYVCVCVCVCVCVFASDLAGDIRSQNAPFRTEKCRARHKVHKNKSMATHGDEGRWSIAQEFFAYAIISEKLLSNGPSSLRRRVLP